NAELSRGRSMIAMGAGTNHWYHSDQIYRTFLTLTMLCGTQGVNGGGWAHYVGQEKVRPLTGFQNMAFAFDWHRPTRHMTGTSFFYLHTDQWRYETFGRTNSRACWVPGGSAARRSSTASPRRAGWAGPPRSPPSTATRSILPTTRRPPERTCPTTSSRNSAPAGSPTPTPTRMTP